MKYALLTFLLSTTAAFAQAPAPSMQGQNVQGQNMPGQNMQGTSAGQNMPGQNMQGQNMQGQNMQGTTPGQATQDQLRQGQSTQSLGSYTQVQQQGQPSYGQGYVQDQRMTQARPQGQATQAQQGMYPQQAAQPQGRQPQEYSMDISEERYQAPRQIRLQLELSETDIRDYGLQQSTIFNEISTRLGLAQIQIKDDPTLPKLVLRIKSILADRAIATFVQLGFFEEAILKRNNSAILALTWSQATLISGPKEELIKEVTQVVISMVNSFILDYNKAFTPRPQQ